MDEKTETRACSMVFRSSDISNPEIGHSFSRLDPDTSRLSSGEDMIRKQIYRTVNISV